MSTRGFSANDWHIWVYEVKHYSGEITCERGQWRTVKTYRQPGGRLVRELEVLRPFDKQWVKEASAVKEALRRGSPETRPSPRRSAGGSSSRIGGYRSAQTALARRGSASRNPAWRPSQLPRRYPASPWRSACRRWMHSWSGLTGCTTNKGKRRLRHCRLSSWQSGSTKQPSPVPPPTSRTSASPVALPQPRGQGSQEEGNLASPSRRSAEDLNP